MLLYLACSSCGDARERETIEYRKGVTCPSCDALLLFVVLKGCPLLSLKCRGCGHMFFGMDGREHIYSEDYRCPKCKRQTYPATPTPKGTHESEGPR